uniref:DUF4378 domain-containing protein n=1 Tax=Macrostomum lignano TaxID=282301 RepID=A0A1I8FIP9_9PLAT
MQDEAKEKSESLQRAFQLPLQYSRKTLRRCFRDRENHGSGTAAILKKFDGAKAVAPRNAGKLPSATAGDALDGPNRDECSTELRQSLLELLDAMVFTAEEETGKAESAIESKALLGDVLEKSQAGWAAALWRAAAGQAEKQDKGFYGSILETAQSNIPESMSDIIDLQAEYEALLEVSIGAAIEKTFEPKLQ